MKGQITKIDKLKMSRNEGEVFYRVYFQMLLPDGVQWAKTDVVPSYRNSKGWKNLVRVGNILGNLQMRDKTTIDADSKPSFLGRELVRKSEPIEVNKKVVKTFEETMKGFRLEACNEEHIRIAQMLNEIGILEKKLKKGSVERFRRGYTQEIQNKKSSIIWLIKKGQMEPDKLEKYMSDFYKSNPLEEKVVKHNSLLLTGKALKEAEADYDNRKGLK